MATDLGRVGILVKGDYNSASTYEVLDCVTYNGSLYLAKQSVPAGTAPTNTTYWNKSVDVQNALLCYTASATVTTANTNENFYYTLPDGVNSDFVPFVSLGAPGSSAAYTARVFAAITNNKLRIGINASYAQNYYINVFFVKNKGTLTPTTN